MSITSKLLLTIFFCSAQQAKYSRHKQLIMIYRPLVDFYKTVKIHHDNTEVKQSNVVLMYSSSIQLLQLGPIQVGSYAWILDTKFRNLALAGDGNRGNYVTRTRIRKPGSTFFPCICTTYYHSITWDTLLSLVNHCSNIFHILSKKIRWSS